MLTRIRNSAAARRETVELPFSKVKFVIAKILEKQGYLAGVETVEEKHELKLKLSYRNRLPAFTGIRRISKPGRRMYLKNADLPTVLSGNGIAIISTSQGMMTNLEAKARKLGGEIVCEIY